ncbi:hypothetical protein B0H65DRAFT_475053 [Neurospora tetraspora]|uniref:Uncharacterized protein n=1 Tax=Neurospora tetraspora TaxID=94610 RepID=A0AAE0J8R6_9PEZI|nr:hypothetical protein B0H65DRAFT_475053 [Neurospora tetraspora]
MDASGTALSDDGSLNNKVHALSQWSPMWQEGGRKTGYEIDLHSNNMIENVMKEAGFVNIVSKDYKVSVSLWSKDKKLYEVGLYFVMNHYKHKSISLGIRTTVVVAKRY